MSRIRRHLSYANVMSSIALFIALSAGAYAAVSLDKNSVLSKHIKDGQVKSDDLAPTPGFKSPILQNSWVNLAEELSSNHVKVGYTRDAMGFVHLRGQLFHHAPETLVDDSLFQLPQGYRPGSEENFSVDDKNIAVRPDGDVASGGDVGNYATLNGITFRCAPAGQNGCP